MNLLGLVQFVQAQVGTSGDLPWSGPQAGTLFSGGNLVATGQYAEFVNWVLMAYKDIQNDQPFWNWRVKQGALTLTAAQGTYTLAQIQSLIPDWQDVVPIHYINADRYALVYDPAKGVADETNCYFYPYQDWRGWKDRQVVPSGKPTYFTRLPNYSLQFNAIPDKGYTLVTDYYMAIDVMPFADSSTPATLPARYHEAICWKAVMYWAQQRENGAKYQAAQTEFKRIMNRMYESELPDMLPYQAEFYG